MSLRRLNRAEYVNAVRDLLEIEIGRDVSLPPDDTAYGFDDPAGLPSVSPLLVERYMSAARHVSHAAAGKFSCPEADEACAQAILAKLARRAYRRPVAESDLAPLRGFYKQGGIERALEAILASPDFLLRIDHNAGTDLELASRLSFFLWSSIPDEQLLEIAEKGRLNDPGVLEAQTRRMLADPKSAALVRDFAEQWLQLRNLAQFKPDKKTFPEFDNKLRAAFQRETELFVGTVFREDRSVMELIDADFTFLNQRLAEYYGIAGVTGDEFRRVTLEDPRRGGLLGQASVLAVTSYPNRTSVVLRGKWILDNLLGSAPPPPPPNVPKLKPAKPGAQHVSMREQMEAHRTDPTCSACHSRMDALGFALENYNAIGEWRDVEGGESIDVSAKLPDGTEFAGLPGLKKVLLSRKDQFVRTLTGKLMVYALGNGLDDRSRAEVGAIAGGDPRFSALILGIVKSEAFQMRRPAE